MSSIPPSRRASELEAEAARLRAGFDDLTARIARKVGQDRALSAHLAELERQAAALRGADAPAPAAAPATEPAAGPSPATPPPV